MVYVAGRQDHKVDNADMVEHIVGLVEARAAQIEAEKALATAGAAAVEALEEAEDIRAARAALAGCAPRVPLSEVLAEYADDLAAYPNVDPR